jgi:rhamnosyltransferase
MEKMKMLGVVTLYNTDKEHALHNIALYAPYLDRLIVWDNSPTSHQDWFDGDSQVDYQWTGENRFIAPAINYALRYAVTNEYQTLLLMDEDSQWPDFAAYRTEIESILREGRDMVFTPYVDGCDHFEITDAMQPKRLFINSGTVIPIKILRQIGGADEDAFPLDALDHDLSLSVIEHGYAAVCLTRHHLRHSLGQPRHLGPFHIFTPNYNWLRTYNMTRSHIICYKKHRALMTPEDKDYLYNEIIRRKFFRIILAEPDKLRRMTALLKGLYSGIRYKIKS